MVPKHIVVYEILVLTYRKKLAFYRNRDIADMATTNDAVEL